MTTKENLKWYHYWCGYICFLCGQWNFWHWIHVKHFNEEHRCWSRR